MVGARAAPCHRPTPSAHDRETRIRRISGPCTHGDESPAIRVTGYFCSRGLKRPPSAMRQLLLVVLLDSEPGHGLVTPRRGEAGAASCSAIGRGAPCNTCGGAWAEAGGGSGAGGCDVVVDVKDVRWVLADARTWSVVERPRARYSPNQRARRAAPNSRFSAASSSDGPANVPLGGGPLLASMFTRPTRPPPNST